ncbi:hypothetical protein M422DRAFT_779833 [Sphaerobolus stellatus SS14]|uniref:Uncharacterized protein n=1 Tax=Sphaerobolus stellatus (strain SS14) TaxID=990650 RepID=A0A0C9UJY5_SPHS4|nr:hypothetical protein M422DRAFT_779833 [Sphaerobolus stellatus SS14]
MSLADHLDNCFYRAAVASGLIVDLETGHIHPHIEKAFLQHLQTMGHNYTSVHDLNLGNPPKSISDMEAGGVRIVQRSRTPTSPVPAHHYIVDAGNKDLLDYPPKTSIVQSTVRDWYTVEEKDSVIFVDDQGNIELAILRNVCSREDVVKYVTEVIEEAADSRRNVRPHHHGKVIQFGYNAGQWHYRLWGLVNNIKNAGLSSNEKARLDSRMLNVFSITWNIILSKAPAEAVEAVMKAITDANLPPMAAAGFEGKSCTTGYSLEIGNTLVTFPFMEHPPCEGYFAINYAARTHRDMIYAPYAFSWQTHCRQPLEFVGNPGGNYTDLTLGVTVHSSNDSLMIFRPNFLHGTTLYRPGTERAGVLFTFSRHIKEAYEVALQKEAEGVVGEDCTAEEEILFYN